MAEELLSDVSKICHPLGKLMLSDLTRRRTGPSKVTTTSWDRIIHEIDSPYKCEGIRQLAQAHDRRRPPHQGAHPWRWKADSNSRLLCLSFSRSLPFGESSYRFHLFLAPSEASDRQVSFTCWYLKRRYHVVHTFVRAWQGERTLKIGKPKVYRRQC